MSLTKVKDGVSATSLDGLTDVELSALSDGDIIAYSSSSGKFENTAAGGGGGSYTDEQARDAVGAMLTDTATVDFTYDDAGDTITADVIPSGITVTDLSGVTTVAGSLLDDTSYGAMRTTLELGTAATSDAGDFAAVVHTHAASDIVSGTIATARLGSGTADSSTYLRGDGAWATVAGGSYTNENAQDAVGSILTDSSTIDFTYDDGANTITAAVLPGGITVTDLSGVTTVAGSLLDDTSVGAMRDTLELGTAATSSTGDFAAASHTHAATDITSGTFADARVAQTNVTQHQAALSITESQISDLGTYASATSTTTFTNKTFDANGTGNSITNIETADLAAAAKTGSDTAVVTGTAGTNGNLVQWNADGDAVDSTVTASEVVISDPSAVTGADAITNIMSLTQAEYDAIGTPNVSTLYVITS